jgi:hypothetical protein
MTHVVLLGDSIFDNGVYVPGQPDVVRQLRGQAAIAWRATLNAVDGAVTGACAAAPAHAADATHLVVSVGGNDALAHIGVLQDRSNSIGDALHRLAGSATGSSAITRPCWPRPAARPSDRALHDL